MSLVDHLKSIPDTCAQCVNEATCSCPCRERFNGDLKFLKNDPYAIKVIYDGEVLRKVCLTPKDIPFIRHESLAEYLESKTAPVYTLMRKKDLDLYRFMYDLPVV